MPWKRAPSCATGPQWGRSGSEPRHLFHCPAAYPDSQTRITAGSAQWKLCRTLPAPPAVRCSQGRFGCTRGFCETGQNQYSDRAPSLRNMNSKLVYSSVAGSVLWLAAGTFAQNVASPASPPPVSYSSVSELNSVLPRIDEAAKASLADL